MIEYIFSTASSGLPLPRLRNGNSYDLTLVSNSSSVISFCERVYRKSRRMFGCGAYLHWYYKHGLSQVRQSLAVTMVSVVASTFDLL